MDHFFAIWGNNNKLLLHSTTSNNYQNLIPERLAIGFSEINYNSYSWRSYFYIDHKTGIKILTAQRNDLRLLLTEKISRDHIVPLVLLLPFIGLLIWLSFNHSIQIICNVAREVKNRKSDALDPIDTKSVPHEILPLITELNRLFKALESAFLKEKRFTSDAAHELKTPLAALKSQVEMGNAYRR